MKKTLTYKKLDQAFKALKALSEQPTNIKTSLIVLRNIDNMREPHQNYVDVEEKVFKKHGEEEGMGRFIIQAENQDEFQKEMSELLETEVEVEFEKIHFDDISNLTLAAKHLGAIEFMMEGME